jgi:signal peptidase I
VEGQTLEIRDKKLWVDGKLIPDPRESKHIDPRVYRAGVSARDNYGPAMIPAGHVFVLGDNRDNSRDSRYWGFLNKGLIKGKALVLYWSWERLPGDPELAKLEGDILASLPKFALSFARVLYFEITHLPGRVRWGRLGRLIRAET